MMSKDKSLNLLVLNGLISFRKNTYKCKDSTYTLYMYKFVLKVLSF